MFSNASSFSFFEIKLKRFSIGLRSGLRGGIENKSALTFSWLLKQQLSFALDTRPAKANVLRSVQFSCTHLGKVYVPLMRTAYHPNELGDIEQRCVQGIGLP